MKKIFGFLFLVILFSALLTPGYAKERKSPFDEHNEKGIAIAGDDPSNGAIIQKPQEKGQSEKSSIKAGKIIIYGSSSCCWCKKTKEYFNSKGISFIFKEISDSDAGQEMIQKLLDHGINSDSIPVIDIGGDIVQGFDTEQIDNVLKKHGYCLK
ncbi:MAG: hypothetical protein HQM08_26890 [Candidatus Riflebacteria bacterium]|nr:hypothetical protein [Candidatus Riflebacteria bacterium]